MRLNDKGRKKKWREWVALSKFKCNVHYSPQTFQFLNKWREGTFQILRFKNKVNFRPKLFLLF